MKQLHPKAIWLFFFNSVSSWFFVLGIPLALFIFFTSFTSFEFLSSLWLIIPALLALFFILAKLRYHFYRYELTETAFKKEHGIIWKKYVSIPYVRIQNVDIYRGLIARLLGLSDIQIQTAGGITAGSYGAFAEGRLPGLSKEEGEKLREDLIQRVPRAKGQGL